MVGGSGGAAGGQGLDSLLDSGASNVFLCNKELLDPEYIFSSDIRSIKTANASDGSNLRVERSGLLFAVMHGNGGDASLVIRARAHLVPGMVENLVAASLLTSCRGCSLSFGGDPSRPGKSIVVYRAPGAGSNGEDGVLSTREVGGVYPISLMPLSDGQMTRFRKHFGRCPPREGLVEVRTLSSLIEKDREAGVLPAGASDNPGTAKNASGEAIGDVACAARPATLPDPSEEAIERAADRRRKRLDTALMIHQLFGHASPERLYNAVTTGKLRLPSSIAMPTDFVELCQLVKCPYCQRANPMKDRRVWRRVPNDILPFSTLHMDMKPMPNLPPGAPSSVGALDPYLPPQQCTQILVAVCEATRYTMTCQCSDKSHAEVVQAIYEIDILIRKLMVKSLESSSVEGKKRGYTWDRIRDTTKCIFNHVHCDKGSEFYDSIKPPGDVYIQGSGYNYHYDGRGEATPKIELGGRFSRGGGPFVTVGHPTRKDWCGVVERKIQTCGRNATTLLLATGAGAKAYGYAFGYSAQLENILETTVPDRNSPSYCKRGVPFELALGFPFDASKRPPHAFGALVHAIPNNVTRLPKGHVQRVLGVYLMPEAYPSRNSYISTWKQDGSGPGVRIVGPEIKVSDGACVFRPVEERLEALRKHAYSRSPQDDLPPAHPWTTQLETDDDIHNAIAGADNGYHPQPRATDRPEDERHAQPPDVTTTPSGGWVGAGPFEVGQHSNGDGGDADGAGPSEVGQFEEQNNGEDPPETHRLEADENLADVSGDLMQLGGDSDDTTRMDASADEEGDTYVTAPEPSASVELPAEEADEDEALSPLATMIARGMRASVFPMMKDIVTATEVRGEADAQARSIRPGSGEVRKQLSEFSPEEIQAAIDKEKAALDAQGVFRPEQSTSDGEVLEVKIILAVKRDNTLKARLVGLGYRQRHFLDYYQTYSPVASIQSILLIVILAATFGVPLWTADAKSAYLQADMEDVIYVHLPQSMGGGVHRMVKALYGTKQAGLMWYRRIKSALEKLGLRQTANDPCLFFRLDERGGLEIGVVVVVDDILSVARKEVWDRFITELTEAGIQLDVESVGPAQEFNGIRITKVNDHRYELDQEAYLRELSSSYAAKWGWTPPSRRLSSPLGQALDSGLMEPGILDDTSRGTAMDRERADDQRARREHKQRYLSLLGSLMWLAFATWPSIAYAVGAAGQRSQEPMSRHLAALERVLSYCTQNIEQRLVFDCSDESRKGRCNLAGFSDSDHAADKETRRSRSGIWIGLNECPLYWSSKRQTVVTKSSAAAETVAFGAAMERLRGISEILHELGFDVKYAPLFGDNVQVLRRTVNDMPNDALGAKQLAITTKSLQEAASTEHKTIWPFYCSTLKNVADSLTKGHLSGKDGESRWQEFALKTRGASDTPGWVSVLMNAKREFGGNQAKHGAQPMALERARPMTDLGTYFSESGWGKRYDLPFGGRGSEPQRIDAQSAQPACAERGSEPQSVDARSAQPACARCRECTCRVAVTNVTGGHQFTVIDQEEEDREYGTAKLASWQLDSVKAAPKLKGKFVSLELFSGENHSFTKALIDLCESKDQVRAYTLDLKESTNPTIVADVTTWDPTRDKRFRVGRGKLKVFWSSPDCTQYSVAKTVGVRDFPNADLMGLATVRLIFKLLPKVWMLENPVGWLQERPFMWPLRRFRLRTSYCQFDDPGEDDVFPYRKDTVIYTNVACSLPTCQDTPCSYKREHGRHKEGAQGNSAEVLHRVPRGLCQHILLQAFGEGPSRVMPYHPNDVPAYTDGADLLHLYVDESIPLEEALAKLNAAYDARGAGAR